MYEVHYQCFYRDDKWYHDSTYDNWEAAIARAQAIAASTGRGVSVGQDGTSIVMIPRTRTFSGAQAGHMQGMRPTEGIMSPVFD